MIAAMASPIPYPALMAVGSLGALITLLLIAVFGWLMFKLGRRGSGR